MRRSIAAIAGVIVTVGLIVMPAAGASAVEAPKIDPVYDLPSTWAGPDVNNVLTEEEAALRKHEIDLARKKSNGGWISAVKENGKTVGRVVWMDALGTATTAGIGFGLALNAEGVVQIIAATQGTTTEQAWCQQPEWFQTATSVFSFGSFGHCNDTVPYVDPNLTSAVQITGSLVYTKAGKQITVTYLGTSTDGQTYCYRTNENDPGGDGKMYAPAGMVFVHDPAAATHPNGYGRWNTSWATNNNKCSPLYGTFASGVRAAAMQPSYGAGPVLTLRTLLSNGKLAPGPAVATMPSVRTDPERQTRCSVNLTDGSTKYGGWVTYRESTGFPIKEYEASCNTLLADVAATDLSSVGVQQKDDQGIRDIARSEVDPAAAERADTGRKSLILTKAVNGVDVNCINSSDACTQWWTETNQGTTPGAYRCTYGGAAVDFAECSVYRNSFNSPTPTITDPVTGEQIDWTTNATNSTSPANGPTPGEQCMDEWSSAPNPLEWVFQPVKCAFVWAFIPRDTVIRTNESKMVNAWQRTAVGQLPTLVAGLFVVPDGGSECRGPHVVFSLPWGSNSVNVDAYPLSACDEPIKTLATAARIFGAAALIFFTALGVVRKVSSIVSAPGIASAGGSE